MDILVIGGSVFVGWAVVRAALDRGDTVTVFNRGQSGANEPGVRQLIGDRANPPDLEQLGGHRYDVVVDTCGYIPNQVAASSKALVDNTERYVFVSSVNAYAHWPGAVDFQQRGLFDGNPDAGLEGHPDHLDPPSVYGWRKVGCERAVHSVFGEGRTTVVRPAAIVGPHDSAIGRLPWWIHRVAQGGTGLSPGAPEDPLHVIDVQDLADFLLAAPAGEFDAVGAPGTRASFIETCRTATGSDYEPVWIDDDWLASQDVDPWTEIPLWAPESDAPGIFAGSAEHATAAGLRYRPLSDTISSTWQWMQTIPGGWQPTKVTPGLDPAKESALLTNWAAR